MTISPADVERWAREAAEGTGLFFDCHREWAQRFAALAYAAGRASMQDEARPALEKARWCADYMASGMTHAGWVTERAKDALEAIRALKP